MKILEYKALAQNVLVVAVEGQVEDWAAYIKSVLGINHLKEQMTVAQYGTKLSKELAKVIFPDLDISKYRE